MNTMIPEWPSRGGTGRRLNVPRSKFKRNRMLNAEVRKVGSPAPDGTTNPA
jgi:hypothetical protein